MEAYTQLCDNAHADNTKIAPALQTAYVTLQAALGPLRVGKSRADLLDIAKAVRTKLCAECPCVKLPKCIDELLGCPTKAVAVKKEADL